MCAWLLLLECCPTTQAIESRPPRRDLDASGWIEEQGSDVRGGAGGGRVQPHEADGGARIRWDCDFRYCDNHVIVFICVLVAAVQAVPRHLPGRARQALHQDWVGCGLLLNILHKRTCMWFVLSSHVVVMCSLDNFADCVSKLVRQFDALLRCSAPLTKLTSEPLTSTLLRRPTHPAAQRKP